MNNKVKSVLGVIGYAIASIFFGILVVNNLKSLSYKEVEATLISPGDIINHTGESNTCTGTFEYFVNDMRYEASLSIDYQYCFKGYKRTIYYDSNNPTIYSKDKSIFLVVLFGFFSLAFVVGLLYSIKELFKQNDSKDSDNRLVELDSDIYGKYKLKYDSKNINNSSNDRRCVEISTVKPIPGHSFDFFEVFLPKDILNNIFEANRMNHTLELYNKIKSNDYNKIMEKLINQEIKTLSTWCEVPNSAEGKKMLLDNGTIISTAIEIDKDFNIAIIYFDYYYKEVGSGSFSFSYEVKNEKIESLGASR